MDEPGRLMLQSVIATRAAASNHPRAGSGSEASAKGVTRRRFRFVVIDLLASTRAIAKEAAAPVRAG